MSVNETKTNIVHFRKQRQPLTNFVLHIGDILLDKVDRYIYLASFWSDAAGRALGALIGKTRHLSDLEFKTFEKLFDTGVILILGYSSEICGLKLVNQLKIFKKELYDFI